MRPSPTLARDIAQALPDEWESRGAGVAYPTPQTRVSLQVDLNPSWAVLNYEESDPDASDAAFAEDLLQVVGPMLSPSGEAALTRNLVQRMSEWQASSALPEDYTGDLLRQLLAEHNARISKDSCDKLTLAA